MWSTLMVTSESFVAPASCRRRRTCWLDSCVTTASCSTILSGVSLKASGRIRSGLGR